MNASQIRRLALGGLLCAIIAAISAYVRVSIPGGYLNPGDCAISLAGIILGPYAAIPSGLGSAIADLLGYPHYAFFSLIVKGLMGFIIGVGCKSGRLGVKSVMSLILSSAVLVGGYFITDIVLADIGLAISDLPWNLLQAALLIVSGIAFLSLRVKEHLRNL